MPIRKVVDDLTLICHSLSAEELANQLIWLPLTKPNFHRREAGGELCLVVAFL